MPVHSHHSFFQDPWRDRYWPGLKPVTNVYCRSDTRKSKGSFHSINQLTIVIGILAAQFINWRIARPVPPDSSAVDIMASWNGQTGWRWMFYACTVPASMFFILMWLVPESPRWLVKTGKNRQRAHKILARIGGADYAGSELISIEETLNNPEGNTDFSLLRQTGMKKLLILGIVLAVFQQWCGINVIFNYAQEIFANAGYSVSDTLFNIVITGSVKSDIHICRDIHRRQAWKEGPYA